MLFGLSHRRSCNRGEAHRSHEQSIGLIQDLVQGHKATKAGIVYLEDQTHSFQARENGRMWTVYGSPVRGAVADACSSLTADPRIPCTLR